MIRHGRIDCYEVLVDETDASILVYVEFAGDQLLVLNYRARNLRVLAEHLSDQISYGLAVQLLTQWGLPKDHPLWILNHKGGLNHFTAN